MNIKECIKLELSKIELQTLKQLLRENIIDESIYNSFFNYISHKQAIELIHSLQKILEYNKNEFLEYLEYTIRYYFFH